jgi:3-phenylpropionate/trans-cinnamate dioxygenase ferredoxin component
MGEYVKVAKVADVAAGTIKGFQVGDKKVAIASGNGKFYAFEDRCAHLGAKLSTGLLLGDKVMCSVHGEQFDLVTGKPVMMVAHDPIKVYPVKVEGDDILVDL